MNLVEAIINNDVGKVKQFLEQGIDPNLTFDSAKLTPLHFAVQCNALEIVLLLVTAGANLDSETEPDRETPCDIAHQHGYVEMEKLLLKLKSWKNSSV